MKKKVNKQTKELLGLGFIALLGLTTLFLITEMAATGNFVYAGGHVQLTPEEACATVTTCKTGPAIFVEQTGWKAGQPIGNIAKCICPEDVTKWKENKPLSYDKTKTHWIRITQPYYGGAYYGYE
ncbi:hypothetical protein HY484_00570 [Candidatus Woesearchaeota archaeon]|nr:hypothetical protein [Candidatus Woesearchaeota archaeon]